ncbi:MAG: recombination protein RecR [Candidatus Nealsonbacteria bacterium]|nr:recombination protein RecR [Candidatus Nealsonbacteria bacterium]
MAYPEPIQKLIEQFSKFPTVGPRTAARFVFYLLKLPKSETEELLKSISQLKEEIKLCPFCFKPFRSDENLCEICSNPSRDKSIICVVEKETDLESIENIKKYRGRYFILGGNVSRLRQEDIKKLRTEELLERVKIPEIQEIIIATNSTAEGEATALYIERLLKPLNKKLSRLGRGLPVGSELEYADEETLSSALDNRK